MGHAARLWRLSAVLGLSVFAAHTLVGSAMGADDFFNRYLYNILILLALAACIRRARQPGRERGAWIALSVGVASWTVAELLFDFAYGGDPPYPSVADAFYLGFYPACYVGLMLLVRSRLSVFGRALWLDGFMATIASAALGAAVLFEAVLRSTDGSTAVIVINLAYPLADILLLSAVVGVFVLMGWKTDMTWGLIGAGLAATAVADGLFLFQTATSTYTEGTVLDALWPASMLLLAAAAWEPATRSDVVLQGRPLLATPFVSGLIGLAVLTYDHFNRLNVLAISLAAATIVAVILRTAMTFRENARILRLMRAHAVTDALTTLGNRRRLVADLERALEAGAEAEPRLLAIYDLDGFKNYNDTFGHPAGDALLARVAASLEVVAEPLGSAYRLGGDEFCVLAELPSAEVEGFLDATVSALSESGEGFAVSCSFGAVFLPDEAATPSDVLRVADQRLYVQKRERTGRQAPHEVLLQALFERSPGMRGHVDDVVTAAVAVGQVFGVDGPELEELRLAALLHDIGKLAMPDGVLMKPGPLDVHDWAFIKEHTVIAERMLAAAPAWQNIAKIVRATHERWDGGGYKDGLSGGEIPLAARIIAVCDSFSAMTSERPYRLPLSRGEALAELRRCAGTQFDPDVVAAFCTVVQLPANQARSASAA